VCSLKLKIQDGGHETRRRYNSAQDWNKYTSTKLIIMFSGSTKSMVIFPVTTDIHQHQNSRWWRGKRKRAVMFIKVLVAHYRTAMLPVAEYACAVWHISLTEGQSQQLEQLQRRAIKIIFDNRLDNTTACIIHDDNPTLASRRETQTQSLFKQLNNPSHCLYHLLPEKPDPDILARLRNLKPYEPLFARTSGCQNSFLIYCLNYC
jgi:hypothetical protein